MDDISRQIILFVILAIIAILVLYKIIVVPRRIKQRLHELENAPSNDREVQQEIMYLNAAQGLQEGRKDAHLVFLIAFAFVFPVFVLMTHYISTHP